MFNEFFIRIILQNARISIKHVLIALTFARSLEEVNQAKALCSNNLPETWQIIMHVKTYMISVLTLLPSERPKLYGVLAVLSAIGLKKKLKIKKQTFLFLIYFGRISTERK